MSTATLSGKFQLSLPKALFPLLPYCRIPRAMKYRQYDDALVAYSEIDAIGKMPRNGFAHITMNDGKLMGCCGNTGQQPPDFGEKYLRAPSRTSRPLRQIHAAPAAGR